MSAHQTTIDLQILGVILIVCVAVESVSIGRVWPLAIGVHTGKMLCRGIGQEEVCKATKAGPHLYIATLVVLEQLFKEGMARFHLSKIEIFLLCPYSIDETHQ
jgi:hypothetical protein